MKLDLQSEQYAATGNISGIGVERSLGSPSLDRLQLLVRETVQNAWDARENDETSVELWFCVRTLTGAQKRKLKEMLSELPSGSPANDHILQSITGDHVAVIEIADYQTIGLGGPVRADITPFEGEPPNFVNFFRNVGSPRGRELGAGTYGYGKSSVFALSRCKTIVGYSQSTSGGHSVSRLMVANVSDPFDFRKKRYTGRHWWGVKAADRTVDPLEREPAQREASSIGMERRGLQDQGTTLMVLDPILDSRTLHQTANAIAEILAWFFWPKMLPNASGSPAMKFSVEFEGAPVAVPTPSSFPPLGTLAEAMRIAKSLGHTPVKCERPIKLLGRLGLARSPVARRMAIDTGNEEPLVPPRCSHVALMRPAELVVRYIVGPQLPSDFVEYAGVFICDEGVEPYFAAAEPPAHDDWVPDHLEGHSKTYVKVALRRLWDLVGQYANPLPGEGRTTKQPSLAVLGDALGTVLVGQRGSRTGRSENPRRPNGKSTRHKTVTISEPEPFRFAIVRKTPCALFRVKISGRSKGPMRFEAKPFVVLEGGSAPDASGLESPKIIAWLSGDGDPLSTGSKVTMRLSEDTSLIVAVSIPGDCAIGVEIADEDAG